jgi:mRNA-degrading endonuclease HigB of HigAB toxin-antitoxin module
LARPHRDADTSLSGADPELKGQRNFKIEENGYCLIAVVDYDRGLVWVRWIGTHADYNRIDVDGV